MSHSFENSRVVRFFISALLLVLPMIVSVLIVHLVFHSSLSFYIPNSGDETVFWIDAKSVYSVGLRGGYSGYEELLGAAPFLGIGTYGGHGFAPHLLTKLVARFTGFFPYTAINIANWIYFGLASLFFVCSWRGRNGSLLFTALFLGTSFPLLSFYVLDWQEPLHVAFALALAPIFSGLAVEDFSPNKRWALFTTGFILLFLASLLRYSWSVLYIPLIFFMRPPSGRNFFHAAALGSLLVAMSYISYYFVAAPYPYGEYGKIYIEKIFHGQMTIASYCRYIWINIRSMFMLPADNPSERLGLLVVLIFFVCASSLTWLRRMDIGRLRNGTASPVQLIIFHVFNIGLAIVMSILWYTPNLRILAPNYLLSVLMMSRYLPSKKYLLLVLINVLLFPLALEVHRDSRVGSYPVYPEYKHATDTFNTFGLEVSKYITYQPGADPWCNTILVQEWPRELLALPSGIATHYYRAINKNSHALKARYVYLHLDNPLVYAEILRTTRLEPLWHWSEGTLYLNLDSSCSVTSEN